MLKDAWYDGGAGEHRHMADSRVKAEHQGKRKMFAHVFAQKTIAGLDPVVTRQTAVLVGEIDKIANTGEPINIRRYLNYFTIDLISTLLYGKSLGCIERGDDIVDAETSDGKVYQVPFIKSLHNATHINTILGFEASLLPYTKKIFSKHPYKMDGANYDNIVYHNTMKRYRAAKDDCESERDDFFQKLLFDSKGSPLNLNIGEILAECNVMLNAGSDTTAAALTGTIYLLYKHPKVLAKLREELDGVMGDTDVPQYNTISNLPYLRACIEESLRCKPASTMGLPRVVPEGGRVIAGKFIRGGVTVSVPTYSLLHDPEAFEQPEAFNPDRWISGNKEKMAKAHLPFSTGPRACIGRNIAYFEQLVLIATLVHCFDFELPAGDFELKTIERFNGNPDELIVGCRRRTRA